MCLENIADEKFLLPLWHCQCPLFAGLPRRATAGPVSLQHSQRWLQFYHRAVNSLKVITRWPFPACLFLPVHGLDDFFSAVHTFRESIYALYEGWPKLSTLNCPDLLLSPSLVPLTTWLQVTWGTRDYTGTFYDYTSSRRHSPACNAITTRSTQKSLGPVSPCYPRGKWTPLCSFSLGSGLVGTDSSWCLDAGDHCCAGMWYLTFFQNLVFTDCGPSLKSPDQRMAPCFCLMNLMDSGIFS